MMIACEQDRFLSCEETVETLALKNIAKKCGGRVVRGDADAVIARVSTDSRIVQAGDLFVALSGEKFDGHDFLAEVAKHKVAAVMVQKNRAGKAPADVAVIAVDDTRKALGRLAAYYRSRFELPVVAVGGSNGKTTTKDLIAAVLSQRFKTLKSEASFNNDIGVPMTLLNLADEHSAAVLEVGTNHHGELAPLVQMIKPGFGVITSIGREHLEFFGDVAGVAQEEGWLAQLLPEEGTLFVNSDTPEIDRIIERSRAKVVRVGWNELSDWRATKVRLSKSGTTFSVTAPAPGYSGEYCLQLLGRHQVSNALLALAVGAELGLGREELRRGLAECSPPKMRLNAQVRNGICVLNDAYNANADSMTAALHTLQEFPCTGRRIAVVGDMAELGQQTQAAHVEVGQLAARLGLAQLITIGSLAAATAESAKAAGLKDVHSFKDVEAAMPFVKSSAKAGDVVLVKASRSSRLERVIEAL